MLFHMGYAAAALQAGGNAMARRDLGESGWRRVQQGRGWDG